MADLGDHVRILSTPATVKAGYADREGTCYGFTTPSLMEIDMVGEPTHDVAISVGFDDADSAWFAPELVVLLDHGEGTVAVVGTKRFIRDAQGAWIESLEPD
jgi:hypothetical protein